MSRGDNFIRYSKQGYPYVCIDAVVDTIQCDKYFVTIFGKKSEEVWMYDEGVYKPTGRAIILTEAESLLGSWAKTAVVNEILNKIKRQTELSREEFDNIPKELLPLENGVLNFKTDEFLNYNPNYYFKTKIKVKYEGYSSQPFIHDVPNEINLFIFNYNTNNWDQVINKNTDDFDCNTSCTITDNISDYLNNSRINILIVGPYGAGNSTSTLSCDYFAISEGSPRLKPGASLTVGRRS